LTTIAFRLRDQEDITKPHRQHLYQLLVNEAGFAHWKITLIYGIAQLAVGAGVLTAYPYGEWPVIFILPVCFIGFSLLTIYVRKKLSSISSQETS
jgi:hypothetical protein